MFGQNKISNDTINKNENIESRKLYSDLHQKENNPLLIVNGIIVENNSELLNGIIQPADLKSVEILKDGNPVDLYGEKSKNGVLFIKLKNRKINTLEKLNKTYSLNDSDEKRLLISGAIYNADNTPISNVVISNLNKKEAYKSDSNGNYSLKANKKDILVYYLEGFESKKITVEDETKINVVLNKIPVSNEPRIMVKKPIIYLYPIQKTDVTISLDFKGELLTTFPKYYKNWTVTAYPDGRIFDKKTNRYYTSLFWDGTQEFPKEHYQYQSGFVVSKNDLTNFLIEKLDLIGLNNLETNDFIQYWLPILEKNEANFIHFYVNSDYDVISKNNVTPMPDTSIRVFMEFHGLDIPKQITEQHLTKTERKGFTLVEWGGSDVSEPINELKKLKL